MSVEKISKERAAELEKSVGGIWLSMDGNCGCALIGENIVEGECEISELRDKDIKEYGERGAERMAMVRALNQLRERFGYNVRYNTCNAPAFN
jgi:hypothetical protein